MKIKFWSFVLTAVVFLYGLCVTGADAQQAIEKKTQIPFPVIPVIAEYEYQPYFFAQWISGHPQYSRIEAILDNLDKPALIKLVLEESGKRVFYCSSEAGVKILQAEGKEVYLTKIDFKTTPAAEGQPSYDFGFRDRAGQPIFWRVIAATRPSERGRELIPAGAVSGLRLEYRDLATAAGAGTAIQIGEKVFEAEPWTQISAPPYFVAYRGTVAVGRHYGGLLLGAQKWQILSRPTELKTGAEWILSDGDGRKRIFKIADRNNGELIISEQGTNSTSMSLVAHATDATDFVLRSVRLTNNSQTMQVRFEPELPLNLPQAGKFETTFAVSQGKYDKIVTGTISVEPFEDKLRLRLTPKSPGWAKSRVLETAIKLEPNGYKIETTQTAK